MGSDKLGPTGEYPQGKLSTDDEGELRIAVGRDEKDNVRLEFGKSIAWVAMPPNEAVQFALTILKQAGAWIQVNVDDAMVERASEYFKDRDLKGRALSTYLRALLLYAVNGIIEEDAP